MDRPRPLPPPSPQPNNDLGRFAIGLLLLLLSCAVWWALPAVGRERPSEQPTAAASLAASRPADSPD